jgi:squalene-associated FAD-dependent desaturase
LLAGILLARGLSVHERLACVRLVAWARRARFRIEPETSVAQLLAARRQPPASIAKLWAPLCIAALNTPLEQASAQVFLNVVRDGLMAKRADSDLVLPRIDLGALFPEPAAEQVRLRGGSIHLGVTAARIDSDGSALSVITEAGPHRHDAIVIATQPYRVPAIAGHLPRLAPTIEAIDAFTYQSIVTVYLQYPAAPARSWPMLGSSDGRMQWLFDRGLIAGQPGLLAAVISARARDAMTHSELARAVQTEIAAIHPDLGSAQWSQVIEEKRATFACAPGLQRPAQATPVPGLYLAGDYTEADYPATLEAAVRSGLKSAALVCGQSAQQGP